MNIIWSPLALERAQEAVAYIAQNDPDAAMVWVHDLFDAVQRLEDFPHSGRMVPEVRRPEIREIFFGSYRVMYRVTEEEVSIMTIRHMRQRFEAEEIENE